MAFPRSSSSASSGSARGRGASAAAKPPAATVATSKPNSARVRAAKTAAAPMPAAGQRKPNVSWLAVTTKTGPSYVRVYRATPLERIAMIRQGIPASEAKNLFAEVAIGQGTALKALNLSTATINRKAKQGATLSPEESERVLGFAKLVGQLQAMIEDSGEPGPFDARAWMARWLTEPLPAFGGARPADLVDTMEGQNLVSRALATIQSGAYA